MEYVLSELIDLQEVLYATASQLLAAYSLSALACEELQQQSTLPAFFTSGLQGVRLSSLIQLLDGVAFYMDKEV